ncbi:hypothetical protein OJAV_G00191620 [Oryzias javanicus]|uniref:NERD domain-containing protein n=1 Tax=Oryzias javanicus TaxID=123683 RepID=A0A3S2MHX5_ORYJA|nr:hypothetical protein OJAV_G00191620 [Oryzias javanicus]
MKDVDRQHKKTTMLQLENLFTHFHLSSKGAESSNQLLTPPDFLKHVMKVTGLRKEDVYCNLRVPDQSQTAKDDIDIVILTGQGVYCIDLKPWRGAVSTHNIKWHVQVKEEDRDLTNTCIKQIEDPLKALMTKTLNLCSHLKRSRVPVRQSLFISRIVFLSPDCSLDEELMKTKELVLHSQVDEFLRSFKEGYMTWISDALTPSWISGHLSCAVASSEGDYQGCQYVAFNRQETCTLEFSRVQAVSAYSVWALLGHTPQVTIKMYKRGSYGWLGKSPNATASIPATSFVMFRIRGEDEDSNISVSIIESITLSK